MDVKLVQESEYGTREVLVDADEFVIGREISCQLRLDHGRVGWRHCRIIKKVLRVLVEDLNSPTGTAINGERLGQEPAELHDGDRLDVGPVAFVALVGDDAATRPAPLVAPAAIRDWPNDSELHESARQILDRLVSEEAKPSPPPRKHGEDGARPILEVVERDGVALARVGRRALVRDHDMATLQQGLEELIASGQDRIALSFGEVEHLSSQFVATLFQAQRRCQARGGELKICGVKPQVREVFSITNLGRVIDIHKDETGALRSDWPARQDAARAAQVEAAGDPRAAMPAPVEPWARFVVVAGRNQGQVVDIRRARFAIGRDERCQLRPSNQTVDPIHALLERRGDRAFLRDCGSNLGTIIGQRLIRNEEVELRHGERFQVGPLILEFHFAGRADLDGPEPDSSNAFEPAPDSEVGEGSSPTLEPISG